MRFLTKESDPKVP